MITKSKFLQTFTLLQVDFLLGYVDFLLGYSVVMLWWKFLDNANAGVHIYIPNSIQNFS